MTCSIGTCASSGRQVRCSTTGIRAIRRDNASTTARLASSIQWRSSITIRTGRSFAKPETCCINVRMTCWCLAPGPRASVTSAWTLRSHAAGSTVSVRFGISSLRRCSLSVNRSPSTVNGTNRSDSKHRPTRISYPEDRACEIISSVNRDFPIPASASSRTVRPDPDIAKSSICPSAESCFCRPMKTGQTMRICVDIHLPGAVIS